MRDEIRRPATLAAALAIRAEEATVPVAGGTDLMVRHRRGGPLPIRLEAPPLFIGHLAELQVMRATPQALHIAAAATLSAIAAHPDVPGGLLAAIREFAAPAIRNAGTIGGNICNASPAGDTLPFLYATGSTVALTSSTGEREMPTEQFILGPGHTALDPGELLTGITIPRRRTPFVFYRKVAPRRSNALSKLSVYAESGIVMTQGRPSVDGFRLAVGAVAPTVVCCPEAEAILQGATAGDIRDRAVEAVKLYEERIKPIDDQRSTATYRRNTALTLIHHILEQELAEWLEQQ